MYSAENFPMLPQGAPFGNTIDIYGFDNQVALPRGPPVRLTANFSDMSTTVYVGHICNRVPDETIKELLDICGQVTKWARQPDPITGKLSHFGFCEFKRLEGAWRAVQLLNSRQVGSKTLVVKADAKVSERIEDFSINQHLNFENEQRVRSTVNALLTTINSKWREDAMANDAEVQPIVTPENRLPVPPLPSSSSQEALPKWYKTSRREEDRLRRIERVKRERQADFEKAVKNWETYEEKKILRELDQDADDEDVLLDRKMKLISQDGGGGKVTASYTWVERKKEIEADNRDRLNEEKEIAVKPERDLAELSELEIKVKSFPFPKDPLPPTTGPSNADIPENVSKRVLDAIKALPKTREGIAKRNLNFNKPVNEQTILKLRFWLRRKLKRLGANDDELILISNYLSKSIEVKKNIVLSDLVERLECFPRLNRDQVEEVASKCMQLLLFSESIS